MFVKILMVDEMVEGLFKNEVVVVARVGPVAFFVLFVAEE